MNITVDKKDAVLAAAIDAERYPACDTMLLNHLIYHTRKRCMFLESLPKWDIYPNRNLMGKKCISKLTQDLILSSNGVGFVLRNFSLKLILQRYATKRTSLRRNSHHLSLNE